MVKIWRTFIFFNFQYVFIQCLVPNLSVRKVDKKLIQRKRDDTLEMCRLFNTENARVNNLIEPNQKYVSKLNSNRRTKRNVVPENTDTIARAESIVEEIYDDMIENGRPVEYRRREITEATSLKEMKNQTSRRFDFAPALLTASLSDSRLLKHNETEARPSVVVKHPWPKKWKHGIIPFFIDSQTYDSELSDHIINAFDYFEKATCIRLQRLRERPIDTDSLKNIEWLYITNPFGIRQCVHSNEHKENHGVQTVVFGYDCLSRGEIMHEIMHVLGFSHEHVRPDRDKYVTILWDNIKPGYKKYFKIHEANSLTTLPYDYSSILHYPARAFSKNGRTTILVQTGEKLGQRDGLSATDVEKVNLIFGSDCVERNRQYLLDTCPTVVKADTEVKQAVTNDEIVQYFKDRLWPFGIVNYKIRDKLEFTIEERENINAVIRHIEKETCIEFRDLNMIDQNNRHSGEDDFNGNDNRDGENISYSESDTTAAIYTDTVRNDAENEINSENSPVPHVTPFIISDTQGLKRNRRDVKSSPLTPLSRRHAVNILILARSSEPGCKCPSPGIPKGNQALMCEVDSIPLRPVASPALDVGLLFSSPLPAVLRPLHPISTSISLDIIDSSCWRDLPLARMLEISTDCFNSVNDLLHLFVHILGLDHQHNMHDRDSYLHIVWDQLVPEIKQDMSNKLPPAASVGMPYDYQSVMHYPWLHIKNGQTNIMYPIWNDGWAMGHWQGLSSMDVTKLNLLYFEQCQERKKLAAEAARI